MASRFVTYAVDKLLLEESCTNVLVYKDSKFEFVSIEYVNSQKYKIDDELLDLARRLVN